MEASATFKTVAICETQPVTAEGFRSLIAGADGLKLVRAVTSLAAAEEILRRDRPDLMMLDKGFGTQSVLQWLMDSVPGGTTTAFVVWGNSITEPEALRLLQAGVKGIVRKTAEISVIMTCIRAVSAGVNWMEDSLFRESPRMERYPRSELTPREQQVLELVEQGLKNKEIARELGIRPGTVKIHLKHIFEKTGVRGRYGLALSGLKDRGLLEMAPHH
ncbi:MAG: LuxR C-terminal-related transcriptional regulator [Bryobacteraceae bacterium]